MTMNRLLLVVAPVLIGLTLAKTSFSHFWMSRLYPFGFPRSSLETNAVVDPPLLPPLPRHDSDKNYDLQLNGGKIMKIYERGFKGLLRGPETIVFGPSSSTSADGGGDRNDDVMYTLTDQGFLISLTDLQPVSGDSDGNDDENKFFWTAETTLVKDLGPGRPLSAKFTTDGSNTLYIADAVLGLTRIQNPTSPTSKVEIIASKVFDKEQNNWTRINYADDLTIGPKTGRVYFSDASEVSSPRNLDMTVDVMYGSKIDSLIGPSGRLIQYDPKTDELKVLLDGIWFANGVGVDADETYLMIGETFRFGILKYHLSGPKAGTTEYIVKGDPLDAYIDGVDCAWPGVTVDSDAKPYCYAANPSEVVPAHKMLMKLPPPIDQLAKSLLMLIPKELAPHVIPYGGVTIVDGETGTFVGRIEDPTGQDITGITGVTVHNNKLYLGGLHNNYIGVYSLP